jgi:hypothetical protein
MAATSSQQRLHKKSTKLEDKTLLTFVSFVHFVVIAYLPKS